RVTSTFIGCCEVCSCLESTARPATGMSQAAGMCSLVEAFLSASSRQVVQLCC
ncbi:hypothetical protein KI387_041528, partial [Taxus chinensis]